jgi:glycosyltransferase involved in cell wall biosynthesis
MVACALKELGHDVRVYTDRRPPFLGDFVYYQNPPINLVRLVNSVDVKADLYFGMPVGGTVAAAACARKYKKRAFCFVFDPLPVMQRFGRSARSADMQPQYWRRMLSAMKWEGAIPISLAECWVKDINEWVEKDNTTWLYPAVNSRVLDRVAKRPRRNALVWTSRIVPHKLFPHALDAMKSLNLELDLVTPGVPKSIKDMVVNRGCEGYVNFHPACSDNKKFQLLRSSRGGILPSQFEGFGISVIEALESGVPFVCYEFPTYREIADKVGYGVYLATFKNRNSLRQKLVWALENGPIKPPWMFRFENMCERLEALMEEFA